MPRGTTNEGISYLTMGVGGGRYAAAVPTVLKTKTYSGTGGQTVTTGSDVTIDTTVIPGGSLNVDGACFRVTAFATSGAGAGKVLSIKFGTGATLVASSTSGTASAALHVEGFIYRQSATVWLGWGYGISGATGTAGATLITSTGNIAESLDATLNLIVTIQNGTASDVTLRNVLIERLPDGTPE